MGQELSISLLICLKITNSAVWAMVALSVPRATVVVCLSCWYKYCAGGLKNAMDMGYGAFDVASRSGIEAIRYANSAVVSLL